MNKSRSFPGIASVFAAALFMLLPAAAWADGFIVVIDAPAVPGHFTFAPLEVTYHRVSVKIDDLIATTTVDEEFYNPNGRQLEGTYIFPLPSGAHIDKFSMDVDGKMMDAELLPADKARQFYEEVVRKAKDPALLEYIGRDALKVRIFPIEPNSRKRVKLSYTQLLNRESGLTEYTYPLNTEKFSARPLNDVSISVELQTKDALKSVYCPSHACQTHREGDHRAVIGFEDHNVRPDTDFKLIFACENKDIGLNLLTYKSGTDDGYYLLLASPGDQTQSTPAQAKDITFVLDTSGSMVGPKLEQAKKALDFCLGNLNQDDRFEILRFSTEVEPLFNDLKPATRENVERATTYVNQLKPIGATALNDALLKALSLDRPDHGGRPYVIVFLTDGMPTIGETGEDNIVSNITHAGTTTHIFTFGIGTDVNTHLLDRIAEGTKGFSQYVLPQEDIELKVSNFYTKIREPALTDVQVSFSGPVRISQMYPSALPDLYKGQMLVAYGRYSGAGPAAVKITGMMGSEKKEFTTDVNFTKDDVTHPFIPRLWATRRVGWLLDEIRMHGENPELKDEIIRLARENGIVTPYTAYLIMEDETRRHVPLAAQNLREMRDDKAVAGEAGRYYRSTLGEAQHAEQRSGQQAVENSKELNAMKDGDTLGAADESAAGGAAVLRKYNDAISTPMGGPATQPAEMGYRQAQNYAQQARMINGRAFYQNGATWTDSTWQNARDVQKKEIKFGSDEYFALLQKHPEAAQWFALGNELDVLLDGTVYQIR